MNSLLVAIFLILIAVVGAINWLASPWFGSGATRAYTAACTSGASLSLDVSVYPHPFDFEQGDGAGWGLFYRPTADVELPLYNDNFLTHDRHGVIPAPFVGWRFDGKSFAGPAPTYTYAPLPSSGRPTIAFDAAARVSGVTDDPRFMNIFVDPRQMSAEVFAAVSACLAAHQQAVDDALAKLGGHFPARDRRYYRPLRLGGIVYGPPPYEDAAYVDALSKTRGATTLPDHGRFRLYRGHSVEGTINGRAVRLSLDGRGEASLEVEGITVAFDKTRKANVPGVLQFGGSGGWLIDGDICSDDINRCAKAIDLLAANDDLSTTFWIVLRTGPNRYAEQLPQPSR